jgi:hypothetical protein
MGEAGTTGSYRENQADVIEDRLGDAQIDLDPDQVGMASDEQVRRSDSDDDAETCHRIIWMQDGVFPGGFSMSSFGLLLKCCGVRARTNGG